MPREPFDMIKIRNLWYLAGFRNFKTSRVGQRHDCMIILKDEETSKYSGAQYYNGRTMVIPNFYYNRLISVEDVSAHMLLLRDRGWLPMKKRDLEIIFCGRASNCSIV